jgi:hypothetical protein
VSKRVLVQERMVMRILFFMRHAGYVRNFEWALRELAARGHQITIAFDSRKTGNSELAAYAQLGRISAECTNIAFGELIPPKSLSLTAVATRRLRLIQDYLRYFDPVFFNATKLRRRSSTYLDAVSRGLLRLISKSNAMRDGTNRLLHWFDELIPYPSFVGRSIRSLNPDLVMVTPLFGHGSNQADYFKALKELGIRSCLPVASWDNLTSKGLAHAKPDFVLVWNEPQKKEAVLLQNLAPESVFVTGAHSYDHWFRWQPSTTREAFLAKSGLASDQPYILFLGSSSFIAPDEPPTVIKWAKALRSSKDPALTKVGILIRPHPQNAQHWSEIDVSFLGNTAIYPRGGSNPVSRNARNEYFDSMYFCRVVVGANTSGFIEAGILSKPVHTLLFDELAETQEGTLHFHHLAAEQGGLLNVSRTLDEHIAKLSAALRVATAGESRSGCFVQQFVRGPATQKSPSEIFADVIERRGQMPPPRPVPVTLSKRLLRIIASPLLLFLLPEYVYSVACNAIRSVTQDGGSYPATVELKSISPR